MKRTPWIAAALVALVATGATVSQVIAPTRADVREALAEARENGMLLQNGEIAEPDRVLAAREANNRRIAERVEERRRVIALLEAELVAMGEAPGPNEDPVIVFLPDET